MAPLTMGVGRYFFCRAPGVFVTEFPQKHRDLRAKAEVTEEVVGKTHEESEVTEESKAETREEPEVRSQSGL